MRNNSSEPKRKLRNTLPYELEHQAVNDGGESKEVLNELSPSLES
ncbi:hypothetical protein [Leptospira mayottensis]|nr:hypothetical protein [Leptospira mayottensis]